MILKDDAESYKYMKNNKTITFCEEFYFDLKIG